MEFTKHCENKEIVAECIASVFEPVEEGWGTLLAKYAAGLAGAAAGTATTASTGSFVAGSAVAGVVGGVGGYAIDKYIRKNLDKMLFQNKEVAKYLKKTCDQILAKKKKELNDNSLSKDIEVKWGRNITDVDELPGFMENLKHTFANAKDFEALAKELDGYHLYIVCDSDHIERIIFYAQSKNTNKIYGWTVPAPEKGEAAKIFHKEK